MAWLFYCLVAAMILGFGSVLAMAGAIMGIIVMVVFVLGLIAHTIWECIRK